MPGALSMQVFNAVKLHRGFIVRVAAFSAVLAFVLVQISLLFMPKEFINNAYPSTSSILRFYRMDRDSLDVLFLGSSHAISAFDTQELFEKQGLRSAVLGSGEQNVAVSYFYFREALKTQKPKAVVMDTLMVFPFRESKPLYSSAASSEKALNFMRPGLNKLRAIYELTKYDPELDRADMALPFLRYHERWDDLKKEDCLIYDDYASLSLHGYNIRRDKTGEDGAEYRPFNAGEGSQTDISPLIRSYLDRIVSLADEKGIELIFVKTPSNKTGADEYKAMTAYAAEKGKKYLDFNEESIYRDCGFDFRNDMGDLGHANYYGAVKITDRIGEELQTAGITPSPGEKDRGWQETRELYERCRNDFFVSISETEEELKSYLSLPGYEFREGEKDDRKTTVVYDVSLRDEIDEYYIAENGELIHQ